MAPSTSLSTSHTVIITVLYSLTLIGAVTGNLLLIFIIVKRRETRTLTGFLFVNMAVADLIVAFFVLPATMANPYTESKWLTGLFGDITCRGVYFVFHVTIAASILSLMFMAIDRYLAVLFPLRNFTTFRRPKLLTLVIWLVSVIAMVPAAVLWTVDSGFCVAVFTVFGTDKMQGMRGYYLYLFSVVLPNSALGDICALWPCLLQIVAPTDAWIGNFRNRATQRGNKTKSGAHSYHNHRCLRCLLAPNSSISSDFWISLWTS